MPEFVDEELDEKDEVLEVSAAKTKAPAVTKPATAKATTKVATAVATPAIEDEEEEGMVAPPPSKPVVTDDDNVDFGDEETMRGRGGMERLRPDKGKAMRFALLSFVKPKKAYTHYVKGVGSFRCHTTKEHTALCCEKLGDSHLTVIALVLHYKNADTLTGKYAKGSTIEWDIKYVQLSQSNFRDISNLPMEGMSVYDLDIAMSCPKKNYEFKAITNNPRWKTIPEMAAEVEAACQPFLDGAKLSKRLGKVVTTLELRSIIAKAEAATEEGDLGDIEDM